MLAVVVIIRYRPATLYKDKSENQFIDVLSFDALLRLLILGSEGFVGQNLVRGLGESHEVRCADLIEKSSHDSYTKFDITDSANVLETVKDADVVIDLVAHALTSSLEDIVTNARVNILGLLNVLEACKKNGIKKIIFTSASSMVGVPQTYAVTESHPTNPKTAYGISKLASEHYLRLYSGMFGITHVIFRFFNIYGPFQKNGLIPAIYQRAVSGQPVTVFGKGDQVRDYVYIGDVVPFFEKASSTGVADNSTFNLGTGRGSTIIQVVDTVSKILGKEITKDFRPERPGEIGNFVADTKRLSSAFGDLPKMTLEDGLRATVDWLGKNNSS
jgi:UDP-glucose 4-epimerase